MAIQKTEAFILKTQPFRSSSLIITFFSNKFGKLKGIAKGVRKEREMRGALYELFTHVDMVFYEKTRSDLHLVSEASIVDSFDVLRARLDTISYASYFCELVDVLTEVHDPHPNLFSLLEVSFRYLPAIPGERIARLFEIKLFNEIGWLPHLTGCIECGQTAFERGFFSPVQGTLICSNCSHKYPDVLPVSRETLSILRMYSARPLEDCLKIIPTSAAERELKKLMESFLAYRLHDALKTQRFMKAIRTV